MERSNRKEAFLYVFRPNDYEVVHEYLEICSRNRMRFVADQGKRCYLCSQDEGMVRNNKLWLSRRNDAIAKKYMIAYRKDTIRNLQKKIDEHLESILSISTM